MKITTTSFPVTVVAVTLLAGCASPDLDNSQARMTEEAVLRVAKPVLPLPPHESYHTQFKNGLWTVWAEPEAGFPQRSWSTVTIRDRDWQVLRTTYF
jgi:hypothetical protein